MKKQLILIAALGLALQGCAMLTFDQRVDAEAEKVRASGIEVPQWRVDAAKHGCHSGNAAAGSIYDKFQKDYSLYKDSSIAYKEVWDDAYDFCKTQHLTATRY